jgi:hypothetical protein
MEPVGVAVSEAVSVAVSVTLALAGVTMLTVIVAGMLKFGFLGFFANQVPSMDLPLPLAILEVIEHLDCPRHDVRWAAGRQEVLVHLGHAAAAGCGKREQAQKRPEREYQAVAHDPLGRGQSTIPNDNRCQRDAEKREADGQHPSPQPFPGLHCHLSPPYRHGEGLGIENLTPPHRQQLESRPYHTDNRTGETLVVRVAHVGRQRRPVWLVVREWQARREFEPCHSGRQSNPPPEQAEHDCRTCRDHAHRSSRSAREEQRNRRPEQQGGVNAYPTGETADELPQRWMPPPIPPLQEVAAEEIEGDVGRRIGEYKTR